jgi:hypothetical protein
MGELLLPHYRTNTRAALELKRATYRLRAAVIQDRISWCDNDAAPVDEERVFNRQQFGFGGLLHAGANAVIYISGSSASVNHRQRPSI